MDAEICGIGPMLVRRQLGRRLRELRERARKTHADAECAGLGHRSTLWRIEAGPCAASSAAPR
jgi:hypothetical protein